MSLPYPEQLFLSQPGLEMSGDEWLSETSRLLSIVTSDSHTWVRLPNNEVLRYKGPSRVARTRNRLHCRSYPKLGLDYTSPSGISPSGLRALRPLPPQKCLDQPLRATFLNSLCLHGVGWSSLEV